MTMNIPAEAAGTTEAERVLAGLHAEGAAVRKELAALRLHLAQVEAEIAATPAALLKAANEQLVLAAMRAESIADNATQRLNQLTRTVEVSRPPRVRQDEREIRELREANERLVVAALESRQLETAALEAHRRQVSFLAQVAHELRNPLMPLRLAAHMLDRARMDEAAHAKLQATIKGQVAQMTRLIGDLLDGSRLTAGKFRLERTLVDLSDILDRAVETCMPGMDARAHRFTREVPAGRIPVLADTVRLVQVFGNLLENSSKYTREGGQISLHAERGARTVAVTISDNGIGITPSALPHVFDMFVRDSHASDLNEGLGIGLAVVRELVRAHEGSVVAASRGKDLGSQFVVTLPLGSMAGPG